MANVIEAAKRAAMTRLNYPPGTRLVLDHMNEQPHPIPDGTWGTVTMVDDVGQIHVRWDNGHSLPVMPEIDRFHKVAVQDLDRRVSSVKEAIQAFMQYEEANSAIYPFGVTYGELSEEQLQTIVHRCMGSLVAEDIHEAIESVVGKNRLQCSDAYNEKLMTQHQGQEESIGGIQWQM